MAITPTEEQLKELAGERFRDRQRMQIDVLREYGSEEWSYHNFREILDSVPVEYQDDAKIAFETPFYSDGSASLVVSYWRDETDEEYEKRISGVIGRVTDLLRRTAEKEFQDYQRLKAKFDS